MFIKIQRMILSTIKNQIITKETNQLRDLRHQRSDTKMA